MVRASFFTLLAVLLAQTASAATLSGNAENGYTLTLEQPGWAARWQGEELWLVTQDKTLETLPEGVTARPLNVADAGGFALTVPAQKLAVSGNGKVWQLQSGAPQATQTTLVLKESLQTAGPHYGWYKLTEEPAKSPIWVALGGGAPVAVQSDMGTLLPAVHGVWFQPETPAQVTGKKLVFEAPLGNLPALVTPAVDLESADLATAEAEIEAEQHPLALPFNPEDVIAPATQEPVRAIPLPERAGTAEDVRSQFSQTMDRLINALFAVEDVPVPGEKENEVEWQPQPQAPTQLGALELELPESALTRAEEKDQKQPVEKGVTPQVIAAPAPQVGANVARFMVPSTARAVYRTQEERLLAALQAATPAGRAAARRALAEFYLVNARPEQAAGVMAADADKTPDGTLIKGVAHALKGDYVGAAQAFNSIKAWPDDLQPHVALWQAYVMAKQEQHADAAAQFAKALSPTASLYPAAVEMQLYLTNGHSLEVLERYAELEKLMQQMAKRMPQGQLPPAAIRLLASAAIGLEKFNDAEALLAQAANNTEDLPTAYHAQYDFVHYLLKRDDLSKELAIGHLEDLRRLWRGTPIERDILNDLGHMYRDNKEFRKSLARFRTYTTYFPNADHVADNTAKMTRIFMAAFEPENITAFDGLGVLGMYFDFRELTAAGDKGDALIEEIGKRLQNLGLITQAIDLYERQLATRVENPETRALFGAILAEVYSLDDRIDDGFRILKETEPKVTLPAELQERRAVARGNLHLIALEWAKAEQAVAGYKGYGAERVRIEAAWGAENLAQLVLLLAQEFKQKSPAPWGAQEKADALRYMYALHKLKETPALLRFQQIHQERLSGADMNNQLNVLLLDLYQDPVAINGDAALAQVSRALQGYNHFVADYNTTLEMRLDELIQREKFNRMRRQPTARRVEY
jgi:TolA-binding protein